MAKKISKETALLVKKAIGQTIVDLCYYNVPDDQINAPQMEYVKELIDVEFSSFLNAEKLGVSG